MTVVYGRKLQKNSIYRFCEEIHNVISVAICCIKSSLNKETVSETLTSVIGILQSPLLSKMSVKDTWTVVFSIQRLKDILQKKETSESLNLYLLS